MLLREAADHTRADVGDPGRPGRPEADPRFEPKAREAEARAALIRQAVLRHQALSLESIRSLRTAVGGAEHHGGNGGDGRDAPGA